MTKYDKKLLIFGIGIVVFIVLVMIGLTYAFFNASVQGNQSATNTVVQTGTLLLEFNDTQVLTMSNALPGANTFKTFTVKNTGNVRQKYDIDLTEVNNTFINNELIYTITSNNVDGGEVLNQVVPTTETTLLTSYIDPGVTITYTMTVKFKETGANQNANQGATFSGKLQIIPRIMGVALGGYIYGDDDNVLPGVTVELHSDPITTTTNAQGYYELKDVPVGVHTLYIKQGGTTLGSKEITLASSTESKVNNNQELSLPEKVEMYLNIKIEDGLNIYLQEKPPLAIEKILSDNTAQSDASINFDSINGNGLYYTSDNQYGEDNIKIYYFRGRVENNWLSFAGKLWRIVRTTSEGGLKLAYAGNGSATNSGFINASATYHGNYNNKYYSGYTFNTSLNGYTGTQTNSNIKNVVDNWYNTNLSSFSSSISTTAVYCNDRSNERIDGSYIYYPSRDRFSNKRPSYACASANASRYTVDSSTGNGYLTYPMSLLSVDEINYAGVRVNTGSLNSYIMDNATSAGWWTLSPTYFTGSYPYVWIVVSGGYLNDALVGVTYGVRPVISLKSSIKIVGGNGTKATPYLVE